MAGLDWFYVTSLGQLNLLLACRPGPSRGRSGLQHFTFFKY